MLPLSGVRVIALEQYGAGPIGTLYLASLGAEVIKIESPDGGDVSRGVGPHFIPGVEATRSSMFFQGLNHNKKSITLDLGTPAGQEVLKKLAANADALASNVRGDVPARLGITYDQLKAVNPRIVCAHLTAYGREGPRAKWPGYDYMMQAEAGYFALTGEPDGPPARFGLSIVDFITGLALAYGLTAALFEARANGKGRDVDVNLFDLALFNLNYVATWFMNAGAEPQRPPRSAHFSLTPCQLFRTRDSFIYLMCNKEKFWRVLCDEVGCAALKDDPRFANYAARLENRVALTEELDRALSRKTTAAWMAQFDGKVPAAPVLTVPEALNNPFVADSDKLMTVPAGEGKTIKLLRPPIRVGEPQPAPTAPPTLGEHTDDILGTIGYTAADIARLRSDHVI